MGVIKRCPTCGRREARSSEANRRYWAIISLLADTPLYPDGHDKPPEFYSKETWHKEMKIRFLGAHDEKLPSGKTILQIESSSDMDSSAFSDYMTKVEVFANENGIYLPE